MRWLSTHALLVCLFMLAACSGTYERGEILQELIIQNKSSGAIHNVHLSVPSSGGVQSCPVIVEKGDCALSFVAESAAEQEILLAWTQMGERHHKDLTHKIAKNKQRHGPLRIFVRIKDLGVVNVKALKSRKKLFFK